MKITSRIISILKSLILVERNLKRKLVSKSRKADIFGVATRLKRRVLYVRVTRILNSRSDVKNDDEIRIIYKCVIKIN